MKFVFQMQNLNCNIFDEMLKCTFPFYIWRIIFLKGSFVWKDGKHTKVCIMCELFFSQILFFIRIHLDVAFCKDANVQGIVMHFWQI